jgi:hypothetical protein
VIFRVRFNDDEPRDIDLPSVPIYGGGHLPVLEGYTFMQVMTWAYDYQFHAAAIGGRAIRSAA